VSEPRVWVLLGGKAGDNTQVRALADELGWEYATKTIVARPWELLTHLTLRVTLAGIDRASSSPLEPRWPDLVITAGRRNEPVARWIQQQSGGVSRLVFLGRPWAPLDCYDLIVTTPQYFLPQLDNVQHNRLPLHRLPTDELKAAGLALESRLEVLPRPRIALLVGGDSGRFVFTPTKAATLGARVNALVTERGGSLLLTNSPRTQAKAFMALRQQLNVPTDSWCWGDSGDNPYLGYLALADEIVVTGESMSMLGEASAMGVPLHIFDMGEGVSPWWLQRHNFRYKPLSHRLGMRLGPTRMRRDVGRIQQALVNSGSANWLGEPAVVSSGAQNVDELALTAARVRELLGDTD
jgi:mitochondrial fission protein ELM1